MSLLLSTLVTQVQYGFDNKRREQETNNAYIKKYTYYSHLNTACVTRVFRGYWWINIHKHLSNKSKIIFVANTLVRRQQLI